MSQALPPVPEDRELEALLRASMKQALDYNTEIDVGTVSNILDTLIPVVEKYCDEVERKTNQRLAQDTLKVDEVFPGGYAWRSYLNEVLYDNTTSEEREAILHG